ncbi:hypothetical protein JOD45_001461 [Scopulibacillus daqui]|uniref:Uncharacterized protein n=1 Tax=Scopulibacillus daqui TaxID=1469162 RepID=A0ABS2PZV5_9BACL|nr:hypothetical protein [Scopulibacillus daqui]MBM7645250.1 hypothetical protein [Scopulibacillus daqui]
MIAGKILEKAKPKRSFIHSVKSFIKDFNKIQPEDLLEKMTNVMFKMILFLGIPYFIFIFIKFLMIY